MRKNRTKKVGMSLAALALVSAMALPVSAAENMQKGDMNIQATVKSDYTLTVPSTMDIPFEQESTKLEITVSGNIEKGKTISVTTDEKGVLKTETDSELPYTIESTELRWTDTELDNNREKGVVKTTNFIISQENWKAAKAGTYKGTVTFTADMQ
ncbi:MAG TPA: hypothetical protein IAB98_12135 [Candidatus Egerieimonas intestinavium]|uniref:Uncharacterized protein n=1 Tax=Candidatus Egerieimonas intestinavium TaxID=2840777 RepID=A0A9D1ELG2_9FIRM|nr:hypothetical protein [Candidatus Egerieimonas intestinavium]